MTVRHKGNMPEAGRWFNTEPLPVKAQRQRAKRALHDLEEPEPQYRTGKRWLD